jgi:7-carboxy-7-deazaguanine synthase
MLKIHEIYRSLQGESSWAGQPCVFIRLTACHLRCSYCDTPHAFHQGEWIATEDVLNQALAFPDTLVEVTGGEPLLQEEVYPLLRGLADAGRTVLLETSGACDTSRVDPRVRIILDVKTPGSGEEAANHWPNLDQLRPTDELKFVVCSRADFDWSARLIREKRLTERCTVLISPVAGQVDPTELAAWVLESGLQVKFQIQLHKLLWGAETRGV